MTISLPSVAMSTAPTVIKTFFQHYMTQLKKEKEDRRTEATDEFMFHEAFAVVKRFIAIATTDTVESLQRFTNTHVPAQPGTTSLRTLIPMASCNEAAALLIEYFGEKDIKEMVGGCRWWQVRGLKGVQGEWIAMKRDWNRAETIEKEVARGQDDEVIKSKVKASERHANRRHERRSSKGSVPKRARSKKRSKHQQAEGSAGRQSLDEGQDEPEESFEELDRLKRVMYYIHGGGYYFGSISTHRLMITRFARKFGGRSFAVNYRKAPNYPWPCPVQDVLAGYLYLINPPPGAHHKPIDPAHIVIAGDSAGGGLALALLGVLRDLGKPMPSGAVLLSPWCDMTHSFPSILQNTDTDIIPRYSFIHKPSTLWPVPGVRPQDKQTTASAAEHGKGTAGAGANNDAADPPNTKAEGHRRRQNKVAPEMAVLHGVNTREGNSAEDAHLAAGKARMNVQPLPSGPGEVPDTQTNGVIPAPLDHLYADPVTIPFSDPDGNNIDIELRQQIQLYATNAQLYHPLCSPILQGSLGGLPPLYILAGDSEVLRDEIIYLAHRAARPEQYTLKKELLEANERCRHDAERYNSQPTKVHLQVYDGQPHVLTLFSFTTSARYAYRAIASFVKHVTGAPTNVVNPFPHLENSATLGSRGSDAPSNPQVHETTRLKNVGEGSDAPSPLDGEKYKVKPPLPSLDTSSAATSQLVDSPSRMANGTPSMKSTPVDGPVHGESLRQKKRRDVTLGTQNAYDGQVPLRRPSFVQEMIRERVDIRGQIRPLEEEHLLQALQVPSDEIGRIKAGPVSRYLTGQELWDKKFKRTAKKVDKERAKNEARAGVMLEQAAREGLLSGQEAQTKQKTSKASREERSGQDEPEDAAEDRWEDDGWADLGLFGPLDLHGEVPPPSAIAGRRDTPDSLELLRQSLHMRAQRLRGHQATEMGRRVSVGSSRAGHRGKSRVKIRETMGAGWRQSAAERQVETRANYGLRAWGGAMDFLSGRSSERMQKRADEGSDGPSEWVDSPVQRS